MSQEPVIQHIRLAKLSKAPENVRHTPPSQADQDRLIASIAARGLLQPLIVRPAARKGFFEVVAGGCRLDALKVLQEQGKLKKTYVAPCIVREHSDREDSLAENLHRTAMHPADEFAAFAELLDQGADIEGVAERFGVAPKHVRQRLKLGKAAPELIEAYRNKEMDLDILMAFTVADDHEAQRAVWDQFKGQYHKSAYAVKQRLTEGTISANSRLGRFVSVEDYEKAGGAVVVDLFTDAEEGYFKDAALVRDLANRKLAAAAKALEADWQWAKPMMDTEFGFAADYERVYPTPVDPPKKVVQELKKLSKRFDEIEALPDEAWTDALADEAEKIDERRAELLEIVENSVEYTAEDQARAGCIVTVGQNGDLVIHAGLIPRTETAKVNNDSDSGPIVPQAADAQGHSSGGRPVTPEQAVRKELGISQVHAADLAAHRLQIAKAYLAKDYEVAFDAALYSLCMGTLGASYFDNPLDLRAVVTKPESSLNDLSETPAAASLHAHFATLVRSWVGLAPTEAFNALSKLSAVEKQGLFAWCVAQCLEGQLAFGDNVNPVIEQIGARLNIDFAAHWRPTAENYWGRVKRDQALEVGGDILGDQWRRDFTKAKKSELAKVLERAFNPEKSDSLSLPDDVRAKAAAWVAPGFAFAPEGAAVELSVDDQADPVRKTTAADEPETNDQANVEVPEFLQGNDVVNAEEAA